MFWMWFGVFLWDFWFCWLILLVFGLCSGFCAYFLFVFNVYFETWSHQASIAIINLLPQSHRTLGLQICTSIPKRVKGFCKPKGSFTKARRTLLKPTEKLTAFNMPTCLPNSSIYTISRLVYTSLQLETNIISFIQKQKTQKQNKTTSTL